MPFTHGAKGRILRYRSSLVDDDDDDDDVVDEFLSARVSARSSFYEDMNVVMEVRDGKSKELIEDSAKEV